MRKKTENLISDGLNWRCPLHTHVEVVRRRLLGSVDFIWECECNWQVTPCCRITSTEERLYVEQWSPQCWGTSGGERISRGRWEHQADVGSGLGCQAFPGGRPCSVLLRTGPGAEGDPGSESREPQAIWVGGRQPKTPEGARGVRMRRGSRDRLLSTS